MSEGPAKKSSRDERLAAKLRENLRRRKAQGKAQARAVGGMEEDSGGPTETLPNRHSES
jgi:hypothetical protein